ncbi:hypothetical protein SH611_19040 [Geminicoccaceae bacterium 1502E]|nr:hypothetical protein [Geminicoccaceae bacterium 1502E]
MRRTLGGMAVAALLLATMPAFGQQAPYIYPAQGQSPEQQGQDEYACYQWAKGQTGVDPARPAGGGGSGGSVAGSAVGGGIAGAFGGGILGLIAGKPKHGMALGAGAGALLGGGSAASKKDKASRKQQGNIKEYYRAFSGCMAGRGYTLS